MAYPDNCGDPYKTMLVDGCGLVCTEPEYAIAIEKAVALEQHLRASWNVVMAKENGLQSWPVTTEWREPYEAWFEGYAVLPEPWGMKFYQHTLSFNLGTYYETVRDIVARGACLMHAIVVDGEAAYGTPGPIPSAPEKDEGGFGDWMGDVAGDVSKSVATALVVALLLGGAALAYDRFSK